MPQEHSNLGIEWKCGNCGKIWPGIRNWRSHFPKCKGRADEEANLVQCSVCDKRFKTKVGLSIHECHDHPALRNLRRKEYAERERLPKGRKLTVWNEEEVKLLQDLDARFKSCKYPNVEIRKFLPTKSLKQISDKRRGLNQAPAASLPEVDILISDSSSSSETDDRAPVAERARLNHNGGDRNIPEESNIYNSHKKRPQKKKNKRTRNQRQRNLFARCQDLYKNCPRKLADIAMQGGDVAIGDLLELPSENDIEELYTSLWGIEGPLTCRLPLVDRALNINQVLKPINIAEVQQRIGKIPNKSAPGVDKVKKYNLRKGGCDVILMRLYNILLLTGYFPTPWLVNRTTLIPKVGKDLKDVRNWRPITIGSIISRIFSSLIDSRIRAAVSQCKRQKGFTKENGCQSNILLLQRSLIEMKNKDGGVVTVIDIAKAFDTIPHAIIKPALMRKGIPYHLILLIEKMYKGCTTRIKASKGRTVNINLKRGVKQGDPLSPILFNLSVEHIIDSISNKYEGIELASENVSILAFADDVVLLGSNKVVAQKQLSFLSDELKKLGMSISVGKCSTFQIVPTNKSWYVTDPAIKINNEVVKNICPDEVFAYLGVKIGPWRGCYRGVTMPEVTRIIKNVKRLKLKPHQKVTLISDFILPRFIYDLLSVPPSTSVLKLIDNGIRTQLKEILHLPLSTTNGIIYAAKRDGGLGFPRMEHIVKLSILKSGIKMQISEDQVLKSIASEHKYDKFLKDIANSLRINWPSNIQDITRAKARMKSEIQKEWEELKSQGQGVKDFRNDKVGNCWLYQPTLLKSSRYIDALRLRSNTAGTKVALRRAHLVEDINCRHCRIQPETLGHVLGLCHFTKPLRIRRHDEIKNLIASKINRQYAVTVEPTIRTNQGLQKPDLIIQNEERVLIVDVSVRYENRDYLELARKEKLQKYNNLVDLLKTRFNKKGGQVIPIIIGSRGAIPAETKQCCRLLKLSARDVKTMSLIALRSSIEIFNLFIDYDKTNSGHNFK
ncbi:hypothetical protein KM043_000647 [Ampulex compressa]|nr:hypothetical protein KM043_000647 [Ampulex compressa]